MKIADGVELLFDPTAIDRGFVFAERVFGEAVVEERVEGGFGGEHSTFDGEVNAFEALRVEETGGVAEDHPSIAVDARHGEPASVREGFGSVANHFAAVENAAREGMELEGLEGVVRVGARVFV